MCVRVFACVCVCLCVYRRQQRAAEPAVQGEVLGHGHVFALQLEHGADEGVDGVWVFVALEVLVDLIRKPLAHSSVVEHVVGPRVQRDGLDLGLAETETRLPLHNHRLHTLELHEFAEVCKSFKRDLVSFKRDLVYGKRDLQSWHTSECAAFSCEASTCSDNRRSRTWGRPLWSRSPTPAAP